MRRAKFGPTVATMTLRLVGRDRTRKRIVVRIGKPYPSSGGVWRCPVEIRGLEPRHPDICGSDSLQALCLATSLARLRLADVMHKGAKLRFPGGDTFDEEALRVAFGQVGA
jgi:uncharacterized protein DUF6968